MRKDFRKNRLIELSVGVEANRTPPSSAPGKKNESQSSFLLAGKKSLVLLTLERSLKATATTDVVTAISSSSLLALPAMPKSIKCGARASRENC